MTGLQRARRQVVDGPSAARDEKRRRRRVQRRRDRDYIRRGRWDAEAPPVERIEPWHVS